MKHKNHLPGAMAIAAKCVALDRVTVEPQDEKPSHSYNPEIRVLRLFNWEKRLIRKSINHLTERIDQFCDLSANKPIFKPYMLYNPVKCGIWMYNEMNYDIIAN